MRPGGIFVVGVPIFLEPLAKLRRWRVGRYGLGGSDHVQTYSLKSIRRQLLEHFRIDEQRGFRIISGGVLRNLENRFWWYRFNRWLGERLPAYCIEVQLIATHSPARPAVATKVLNRRNWSCLRPQPKGVNRRKRRERRMRSSTVLAAMASSEAVGHKKHEESRKINSHCSRAFSCFSWRSLLRQQSAIRKRQRTMYDEKRTTYPNRVAQPRP